MELDMSFHLLVASQSNIDLHPVCIGHQLLTELWIRVANRCWHMGRPIWDLRFGFLLITLFKGFDSIDSVIDFFVPNRSLPLDYVVPIKFHLVWQYLLFVIDSTANDRFRMPFQEFFHPRVVILVLYRFGASAHIGIFK